MKYQAMIPLVVTKPATVQLGRVTLAPADTKAAFDHDLLVYFRKWLADDFTKAEVKLVGSKKKISEYLNATFDAATADDLYWNNINPFTSAN